MLFGKKLKLIKKPNRETEEKLRENIETEGGLEKKDVPAMLISAFLIFIPVALIALLLLCGIGFLLFGLEI